MPRLTDNQYQTIHNRLRRYWLHTPGIYSQLSQKEQRQLHDYFQPAKDLTEPELLIHRTVITTKQPALPQQAGRALKMLDDIAVDWAVQVNKPRALKRAGGNRREHHITVRPVLRPEPDLRKLAPALLEVARQQMTEQGKEEKHDQAA